jgi:hypothetical protein
MKRNKLISHLKNQGCELLREGGRHSIWTNPDSGKMTAVPRHNEIKDFSGSHAPAWEPSLDAPASRENRPRHLRLDGVPTLARGNEKKAT